jgi:hypothetical protein
VTQPFYEFSDLHDRHIEGKFYNNVLGKVTVSPESLFQIDKIVRTRNKGGIKQHLVKWKCYDENFNTWINESGNNSI